MSGQVAKRPRAVEDLTEQALYIGEDSPDVALRFLDAAEHATSLLAESPGLGSPYIVRNPRMKGLRVWRIRGFESHFFLIFYLQRQSGIEIVRVLHAARELESILDAE